MLEEGSGLTEGTDFDLVFSPERVLTGRVFADLRKYPKLVGGIDAPSAAPRPSSSTRRCSTSTSAPTSPARTASGTSAPPRPPSWRSWPRRPTATSTSAWRTSSPASPRRNGIDVYAGHRGVATPSPTATSTGPASPSAATASRSTRGFYLWNDPDATVVRAAREANAAMPAYAVGLLAGAHGDLGGQRVVVLGAAYRGGVKETAFSGVFPTVEALTRVGADRARARPALHRRRAARPRLRRRTTSATGRRRGRAGRPRRVPRPGAGRPARRAHAGRRPPRHDAARWAGVVHRVGGTTRTCWTPHSSPTVPVR